MTFSILLVDDDTDTLSVHTRILEKIGYHITAASSGLEALGLFSMNPDKFDMLISDFQMPGMDGAALISEIRKFDRNLPILVISGYGEDQLTDTLRAHRIKFLSKPVRLRDFSTCLGDMLENSSSRAKPDNFSGPELLSAACSL